MISSDEVAGVLQQAKPARLSPDGVPDVRAQALILTDAGKLLQVDAMDATPNIDVIPGVGIGATTRVIKGFQGDWAETIGTRGVIVGAFAQIQTGVPGIPSLVLEIANSSPAVPCPRIYGRFGFLIQCAAPVHVPLSSVMGWQVVRFSMPAGGAATLVVFGDRSLPTHRALAMECVIGDSQTWSKHGPAFMPRHSDPLDVPLPTKLENEAVDIGAFYGEAISDPAYDFGYREDPGGGGDDPKEFGSVPHQPLYAGNRGYLLKLHAEMLRYVNLQPTRFDIRQQIYVPDEGAPHFHGAINTHTRRLQDFGLPHRTDPMFRLFWGNGWTVRGDDPQHTANPATNLLWATGHPYWIYYNVELARWCLHTLQKPDVPINAGGYGISLPTHHRVMRVVRTCYQAIKAFAQFRQKVAAELFADLVDFLVRLHRVWRPSGYADFQDAAMRPSDGSVNGHPAVPGWELGWWTVCARMAVDIDAAMPWANIATGAQASLRSLATDAAIMVLNSWRRASGTDLWEMHKLIRANPDLNAPVEGHPQMVGPRLHGLVKWPYQLIRWAETSPAVDQEKRAAVQQFIEKQYPELPGGRWGCGSWV